MAIARLVRFAFDRAPDRGRDCTLDAKRLTPEEKAAREKEKADKKAATAAKKAAAKAEKEFQEKLKAQEARLKAIAAAAKKAASRKSEIDKLAKSQKTGGIKATAAPRGPGPSPAATRRAKEATNAAKARQAKREMGAGGTYTHVPETPARLPERKEGYPAGNKLSPAQRRKQAMKPSVAIQESQEATALRLKKAGKLKMPTKEQSERMLDRAWEELDNARLVFRTDTRTKPALLAAKAKVRKYQELTDAPKPWIVVDKKPKGMKAGYSGYAQDLPGNRVSYGRNWERLNKKKAKESDVRNQEALEKRADRARDLLDYIGGKPAREVKKAQRGLKGAERDKAAIAAFKAVKNTYPKRAAEASESRIRNAKMDVKLKAEVAGVVAWRKALNAGKSEEEALREQERVEKNISAIRKTIRQERGYGAHRYGLTRDTAEDISKAGYIAGRKKYGREWAEGIKEKHDERKDRNKTATRIRTINAEKTRDWTDRAGGSEATRLIRSEMKRMKNEGVGRGTAIRQAVATARKQYPDQVAKGFRAWRDSEKPARDAWSPEAREAAAEARRRNSKSASKGEKAAKKPSKPAPQKKQATSKAAAKPDDLKHVPTMLRKYVQKEIAAGRMTAKEENASWKKWAESQNQKGQPKNAQKKPAASASQKKQASKGKPAAKPKAGSASSAELKYVPAVLHKYVQREIAAGRMTAKEENASWKKWAESQNSGSKPKAKGGGKKRAHDAAPRLTIRERLAIEVARIRAADLANFVHARDAAPTGEIRRLVAEERARIAARETAFAMDDSLRSIDDDGHMVVAESRISKANVCPYFGREIPEYETLGLEPEKTYKLWRHPEELAKGAETFNGAPLIKSHKAITEDTPHQSLWVGTVGACAFEAPYLVTRPLRIITAEGKRLVESDKQRQLSAGYRYDADMTAGVTPEGVPYDGIMRNIRGNHVALVEEGRAGPDVHVADERPLKMRLQELLSAQISGLVDHIIDVVN